jgi:lysophospholipase L1-like esterase
MNKKLFLFAFIFFVFIFSAVNCKKINPVSGPSPTATIQDNTLYGFEDGTTMGFSGVTRDMTAMSNSTAKAFVGSHSLAVQCNLTSTGNNIGGDVSTTSPKFTSVVNKLITAEIWVPSNFPGGGGAIFMQTGSGWTWQNGWTNFTKGAWNKLLLDPNNILYAGDGVTPVATNQNDVKKIGVQIGGYTGGTGWTGTLYIDALDLSDAPPAATPVGNPPPTVTPGPNNGYANDTNIQYYGRWDMSDPANYRANWGNVYIKTKFTGTSVGVRLWDQSYLNNYQYSIDGGAFTQLLANTSTSYALASGLANATHTITFMRRTDCQAAAGSDINAVTNFWGFTSTGSGTFATVAPDPRPARKMEFIGDSISVGTGDEGTGGNSRFNENGYLAFGPQAAVQLNAEYSVIARGGLGVYYNWNEANSRPEQHAADYYLQTLYNFSVPPWDFSWQPDAVVIALGVNDWGHGGSLTLPTDAQFEGAYSALVSLVRSKYSNAVIFCMDPIPNVNAACKNDIQAVVTAMSATDNKIFFLPVNDAGQLLSASDYIGDYTHPTVAGHAKVTAKIVPEIQSVMGW